MQPHARSQAAVASAMSAQPAASTSTSGSRPQLGPSGFPPPPSFRENPSLAPFTGPGMSQLASASSSVSLMGPALSSPASAAAEQPATPGFEAPDVFCALGSLIVEGRLPQEGSGRGYGEGPHVPLMSHQKYHLCSFNDILCKKDETFRKHMLLLWQNNVPVSIEVLLCSDCRTSGNASASDASSDPLTSRRGSSKSVEYTAVPEPGSVLLEQWTVAMQPMKPGESYINSRGLFQAVRSYLHFSQLSAWYSGSQGRDPKNVLYRITIPTEAFSSKFAWPPEEHIFPAAVAGRGSVVRVSVKSRPRTEDIPEVICLHTIPATATNNTPESPTSSSESEEDLSKRQSALQPLTPDTRPQPPPYPFQDGPVSGAVGGGPSPSFPPPPPSLSSANLSGLDLRRAVIKSRFAGECSSASSPLASLMPRSDSMDSMLGDSLLDPPQSLQKIPPKRYQSPSRCGSPSLEAPDYIFHRGNNQKAMKGGDLAAIQSQDRCARQDQLRRRDISMFSGLHPSKMLQQSAAMSSSSSSGLTEAQEPKLSLPLRPSTSSNKFYNKKQTSESSTEGSEVSSTHDEAVNTTEELTPVRGCGPPKKESWIHEYSSKHLEDRDERKLIRAKKTEAVGGIHKKGKSSTKDGGLSKSEILLNAILRSEDSKPCTPPMKIGKYERPVEDVIMTDIERDFQSMNVQAIENHLRKTLLKDHKPQHDQGTSFKRLKDDLASDSGYQMEALNASFEDEEYEEDVEYDEEDCNYMISPPVNKKSNDIDDDGHSTVRQHEAKSSQSNNNIVPSGNDMATFRKSLDSATSMVFHRKTGLPLTSSPAPLKRSSKEPSGRSFDFDSGLKSPHDIRKALFATCSSPNFSQDEEEKTQLDEEENLDVSVKAKRIKRSSGSENKEPRPRRSRKPSSSKKLLSASAPASVNNNNLLGNFEESVLNGRLEPVSTVEGFTAEIGASGLFHPQHQTLPVTVFFYTLCDNTTISSPYLGHINLGRKGYRVPPKGTVQVTLFNPLGTVVKMFVVMYDLADMPANSQTFLRQRTLYMPSDYRGCPESDVAQKWLRYLIHLRFSSSKSGKIYLHSDVRMIIFRKSDLDTATDHNPGKGFELRSFTTGPSNPKFSPKK